MIATKGIVLTNVKYGETSIICHIFTEILGKQSYIIKGVRKSKSKHSKANIFHPGVMLDMVVYQNPNKQLQFIKEVQLAPHSFYQEENVVKNCIVLFCVELLQLLIIDELPHEEIFTLYNSILEYLQEENKPIANIPLYFLLKCSDLMGYKLEPHPDNKELIFDCKSGTFHSHEDYAEIFLDQASSYQLNEILKLNSFEDFISYPLSNNNRRNIMHAVIQFLQFHAPNFKPMKTIEVMTMVLS